MVLGKLSMPGRATNLGKSRTRAYCACGECGWSLFGRFSLVCLDILLSSVISLFFLPLSWRRPDID